MTHRMILGCLFLGLVFLGGAYFMFLNYYHWIYPWLARKKGSSPMPLLGGLLCQTAKRVAPIGGVRAWAWVFWILVTGSWLWFPRGYFFLYYDGDKRVQIVFAAMKRNH